MSKSTGRAVPTTLMIEEAFVLGHFEELETAASILRGFGCRLTMVFQSYGQIKKLYPETHGLFTAGAILSFRPADSDTCKWLVEKAGKVFVPVYHASDPTSPTDFGVRGGWQPQQRDRIPFHKMFAMPRGRALVWKPTDEASRMSWVKGYFETELAARASPNPYYTPAATVPKKARGRFGLLIAAAVMIGAVAFPFIARVPGVSSGAAAPVVRVDDPPKPPVHSRLPTSPKHATR